MVDHDKMLEALEDLIKQVEHYEKFRSQECAKAELWRSQRQKEGSHEKP